MGKAHDKIARGADDERHSSLDPICQKCGWNLTQDARNRKYFCPNFRCENYMATVEAKVLILESKNVPIGDLKVDGQNPNRMSAKQHKALAESIKRWGFVVPVITNKDLLIADGEQRYTVAKSLGMKEIPTIILPVDDVDRRLIRQVMNKLRGEHDLVADAMEFERIIHAGKEDDLKQLLVLSEEKLQRYLAKARNEADGEGRPPNDTFEVIVQCTSEEETKETLEKLVKEGYKCRVLIF